MTISKIHCMSIEHQEKHQDSEQLTNKYSVSVTHDYSRRPISRSTVGGKSLYTGLIVTQNHLTEQSRRSEAALMVKLHSLLFFPPWSTSPLPFLWLLLTPSPPAHTHSTLHAVKSRPVVWHSPGGRLCHVYKPFRRPPLWARLQAPAPRWPIKHLPLTPTWP